MYNRDSKQDKNRISKRVAKNYKNKSCLTNWEENKNKTKDCNCEKYKNKF